MKMLISLAIVGAAAMAVSGRQAGDVAKLQGTWALESVEIDGKAIPMDELKESRLTVKGQEYLFRFRDTRLDFTIKVDATQTPPAIDLVVADGPEKGAVYKGIFTVDGDKYTICRSTKSGQERPGAFATIPDSGLMMNVWKRARAED
jgi:uncharacterized protein (TIGR03067 family)